MWVLTALGSAFFDSLKPLFGKKAVIKSNIYIIGWAQWFFALFILVPLVLMSKLERPDNFFWFILLLNVFLNLISTLIYWKGIAISDLSLAIPLTSLAPVFLLVTSPIITREFTNFVGTIGVIVAVIGVYILNLSLKINGWREPLKYIFINKGSRLILLAAIIWSITSNLDKVAIKHSSPMFYLTALHVLIAAFLLLLVFAKQQIRFPLKDKVNLWPLLALIGVVSGISLAFQMYAYLGAVVPYVLSVKRVSILFGVIWGALFFKEKQFRERFIGSIIILIGIALILLFG